MKFGCRLRGWHGYIKLWFRYKKKWRGSKSRLGLKSWRESKRRGFECLAIQSYSKENTFFKVL